MGVFDKLTKKGSGEGSEWKIPKQGDEDYPWDTRTAAQQAADMKKYRKTYGITEMADKGWASERERLERKRAEYDAQPDVREEREAKARAHEAAERGTDGRVTKNEGVSP